MTFIDEEARIVPLARPSHFDYSAPEDRIQEGTRDTEFLGFMSRMCAGSLFYRLWNRPTACRGQH